MKNINKKNTTSASPYSSNTLNPLIFSFFAGAGFLDLGFEEAGFSIGYVNEVHGPFVEAYKYSREQLNLPEPKYGIYEGDISDCLDGKESKHLAKLIKETKETGQIVGFIGGPPCPDFSVGGKNKGEHGDNGKLSKTYINLICKHKPDFFVFENVKGLYRTVRHREFFEGLKKELSDSGYQCTERLINSIEYGAPQDRERIILVGFLSTKSKLDFKKFDWFSETIYKEKEAFEFKWPQSQAIAKSRTMPKGIPQELTVKHWFDRNDVENHPNAHHQFKPRAGLAMFETVDEGDDKKKSYKRLHRWRYSPTAAYGNNEVHIHPWLPRRISVAEALAIQSLPKEFVLPPTMSLTNMFKTIGNGVPYLAAIGIALTIKNFLAADHQ